MLKGFPNQINDLVKLSRALGVATQLTPEEIRDDGTYGEALVRAEVLAGRTPRPVEEYLTEQRARPHSQQSHRTSARGLRELFRLMALMEEDEQRAWLTPLGQQLARADMTPLSDAERAQWRVAISRIRLGSHDRGISHPYRVLLRLVNARPGITRAMCALALEAVDDSDEELARVLQLADTGDEDVVWERIGGEANRRSNWDNAKKILPAFAEQLGDVLKDRQSLFPIGQPLPARPEPIQAEVQPAGERDAPAEAVERPAEPIRVNHREVNSDTIARAGQQSDEHATPPELNIPDEAAIAATNAIRAERLTRHNRLVRAVAQRLARAGASLVEDPFDCFARMDDGDLLIEVKTLSGHAADERARVRDALAQLLYYRSFALPEDCDEAVLVAMFEARPSDQHINWLQEQGIAVVWANGADFESTHFGQHVALQAFADPNGG